jgi:serine phosphatase RsbU (regulator of sigma subunit)
MIGRDKLSSIGRRAFSLKTKITILVVFLILAILLSIGYLQIERDRKIHRDYIYERSETVSKTILSFYVLGVRAVNFQEIQRFLNSFLEQRDLAEDIVFISLHDEEANILAGAINRSLVKSYISERMVDGRRVKERIPIETQEEAFEFIDKIQRNRIGEENDNLLITYISISNDIRSNVKAVAIGFSKRGLKRQIFNAVMVNLSIFSVYIMIGILASIFLGGAISKPIKVLEEAMKRVSAGDLNQRLDINSKDEIGTLAATFNFMTEGLREKEKIKREFLVAREVQFNLLPRKVLTHKNMDMATYFEPATEVGGDYYDFLEIGEDRIGIVIADVSGHGMSAGLMMAITKSCLHTQLNYQDDISQMMVSMNNILFELSERRSMVTMFFSILDLSAMTVTFTSAGHPFTYHIKQGNNSLSSLESISYPLAVKRGLIFNSKTVCVKAGEYLVYYSDGIVEALDEDGNVFGFDRMEEILAKGEYSSAQELLETLITEVRIHIGTAEQFDDITAVVVKIL